MGDLMKRWLILAAVSALAPLGAPAVAAVPVAQPGTLHVTQTYLKAKPGKLDGLIAFIEQNWFAMDRIGIERGLFTNYALLRRAGALGDGDDASWDVVVSVGYPTAEGHDAPGVADAFRAIRAKHQIVRVDGQDLSGLGAIVRHDTLRIVKQS